MTESTARPTVPKIPVPLQIFLSEFFGTGVLLLGGLSLVIFFWGAGSPVAVLIPSTTARMVICGFLFGALGGSIALSAVGTYSGAHINPAVTFGFLLAGKLTPRMAFGYVVAQLGGATLFSAPLLLWGEMGRSVNYGATVPGQGYSTLTVLLGEVATTFGLVAALCVFLATRELRRFTPFMIPFLYAIMILASIVQPSLLALAVMLVVLRSWIGITYYVRGEFYREKAKDYVQSAIGTGVSDWSVMVSHILPNSLVPVVTFAPFGIVSYMLVLVSLDYLGFGLPPGTPSWGYLLSQGRNYVTSYPHLIVIPSAALAATLFCVVVVGEAVREAFDPKVFSRLR